MELALNILIFTNNITNLQTEKCVSVQGTVNCIKYNIFKQTYHAINILISRKEIKTIAVV